MSVDTEPVMLMLMEKITIEMSSGIADKLREVAALRAATQGSPVSVDDILLEAIVRAWPAIKVNATPNTKLHPITVSFHATVAGIGRADPNSFDDGTADDLAERFARAFPLSTFKMSVSVCSKKKREEWQACLPEGRK